MYLRHYIAAFLIAALAMLGAGCGITKGGGGNLARLSGAPDFRPVVERYGPAVVNVSVAGTSAPAGADGEEVAQQRGGIARSMAARGGSGFIVSSDGYILSSCHVIEGAKEVTVRLADRREFRARVIGVDKASDVALLKIEAKGLPKVKLGSARSLRQGDWVVAIGSPYGFENSASAGIVSATARALPDETLVPFLQTDVAVNPGNSGGPLFDARGEVVGVNSQIFSMTGGFQGISFAVPIDIVARVSEQLRRDGRVVRGRIGVNVQELNQRLAQSFGFTGTAGALVISVDGDGAAQKAGLRSGDIIVKVGRDEVQRASQVTAAISDQKVGTGLAMQVWSGGKLRNVVAMVAEDPAANEPAAEGDGEPGATNVSYSDPQRIGMVLRALTVVEQYMIDAKGGVLVGGVDGASARAGIQPGDVILAVNGTAVASPEELRELFMNAKSAHVALLVQRGEGKVFVPVER
jgi:serine protease Do